MISVLKNSFSKPSRKILEILPLNVRSVAKYSVSRIIDSKATIMQGGMPESHADCLACHKCVTVPTSRDSLTVTFKSVTKFTSELIVRPVLPTWAWQSY